MVEVAEEVKLEPAEEGVHKGPVKRLVCPSRQLRL